MSDNPVPMRVPAEFRKLVRRKAGEEDLSMYEYLKKLSKSKKRGEGFVFKF